MSEKFFVRLKTDKNFCEFFLALEYSNNLKIITAQEITENMIKINRTNFPTADAWEMSEIKFPF